MRAKVLAVGVVILIIGFLLLLQPDLARVVSYFGEGGYYEFNGILVYPSLIGIAVLLFGILLTVIGLA